MDVIFWFYWAYVNRKVSFAIEFKLYAYFSSYNKSLKLLGGAMNDVIVGMEVALWLFTVHVW